MLNIEERIKEDKRIHLDFARKHRDQDIYIFGAGRMAKPLLEFYETEGIKIKGFCVSNSVDNKLEESGKPIIEVGQLTGMPVAIVFGVNPRLNDEIEKKLIEKGFKDYLKATEYLRYYSQYAYSFYTNPMMEVTTKIGCSVMCKYCPQSVLIKQYVESKAQTLMDLTVFKTCIKKLPNNTLIEFAGFSEPFLNPNCLEMILYANKLGFKLNLFTTLVGVTEEMLDQLSEIQFGEFVLHVPDEENYATIPVTSEYLRLVDRLVDMKKPNGDPFIDYVCSQGHVEKNVRRHLGQNVRVFISLLDRAGNLDDENLFGVRDVKGRLRCEVSDTINHNVLLPDGRVTLCAQDYGLKHVLGNLLYESYESIINGEEAKNVIKGMMSEDKAVLCRNCSLARKLEGE